MSAVTRCQVLVVGSGPGGAVTAATVAEHGRDVLVLEEGPRLALDPERFFTAEEMRLRYRAGGLNPAHGAPTIPFAEARCVGGGSEVNSGLYHRAPPAVLAAWSAGWGVRELSPEALRPHFEAIEAALEVQPSTSTPAGLRLRRGAERLGWSTAAPPRWYRRVPGRPGAAPERRSMSVTYLPAAERAGARLWSESRAVLLERRGGRWRARVVRRGRDEEIEADAVFVCGGAVQTPLLLRRSGIRRNVGDSLALHPMLKVVAEFDEQINDGAGEVPAHQVDQFSPHLGMGCSISTPPHLAMALIDQRDARVDPGRDWPRLAVYYVMVAGPSAGKVRAVPLSPDPWVRYRLSPADLRDLAGGLRRLCRALLAGGAHRLFPGLAGFAPIGGEDELTRIPAQLPRGGTRLTSVHLLASCPMGEDRRRCATDSFGRVHGAPGLHVADASLLCGALGVNPQGTIMALARRNALRFVGAA